MKKITYISVFVLFFAVVINAQDGNSVLKKMQIKIKSADGFSSEFIQSFVNEQGKTTQNLKGKFVYANDDKFIVELKNQKIISDGTTVWNFNKIQKKVIINNVDDDPSAFSIKRYLFTYPDYCNVSIVSDSKFSNSIKLIPRNNDLEFSEVVIYADENYQIKKIYIIDTQNNKYLLELNKVSILNKVDSSTFQVEIPKGTKKIDLR